MKANRTGRDADPRRTIPLQSAQWQRLRASVLTGEPMCRHCINEGRTTPATDLDHASGDPSDNSPENLQPLCHECHSRKTAADHGKVVRMGCDLHGNPADPSHPWNQAAERPSRPVLPALLRKSPDPDRHRPTLYLSVHAKSKGLR